MAQFDIHRFDGLDLVVDCQSDQYSDLPTRLVTPLYFLDDAPARIIPRLTPLFKSFGHEFVMFRNMPTSVSVRALGEPVASLAEDYIRVIAAMDLLLSRDFINSSPPCRFAGSSGHAKVSS